MFPVARRAIHNKQLPIAAFESEGVHCHWGIFSYLPQNGFFTGEIFMVFFPCFFPGLCFQDSVKRARQRRLLAPRAAARPATSRSSRSSTKGPWM